MEWILPHSVDLIRRKGPGYTATAKTPSINHKEIQVKVPGDTLKARTNGIGDYDIEICSLLMMNVTANDGLVAQGSFNRVELGKSPMLSKTGTNVREARATPQHVEKPSNSVKSGRRLSTKARMTLYLETHQDKMFGLCGRHRGVPTAMAGTGVPPSGSKGGYVTV